MNTVAMWVGYLTLIAGGIWVIGTVMYWLLIGVLFANVVGKSKGK